MAKYAKNEAGDLIGDDGSTLRRTERLTIGLALNELVRTANIKAGEVSSLGGSSKVTERHINAYAELGNNTVHLLHGGELKPYQRQIRIHVGDATHGSLFGDEPGIGWALTPNLDEDTGYRDSELMLSVRLPKAEFESLWRQIGEFREPAVRLSLRMAAWQRDIDAHFGPDIGWSRFTLLGSDSKSVWSNYSPIYGAQFHVDDRAGSATRRDELSPPDSRSTIQPLASPSADPQTLTLLRWVVGLLALLTAVTVFR